MLEIAIAIVISTGILSYTAFQIKKASLDTSRKVVKDAVQALGERGENINVTLTHTHHTDKDNKVLISDYENKVKEYLEKDSHERRKDNKNNENPINVDSVSQAVNKVLYEKAGLSPEDLKED